MEQQSTKETSVSPSPYNHDKSRGKWESPNDFMFACVGNGFKIDAMLVLPLLIFAECGIYAPIYYLVALALCAVPLILLQSFLGQFSSTGFISVFRVARFYKGIGYISLVINFTTLLIYGVFSSFPLLYILNELGLKIPFGSEETFNDKNKFPNNQGPSVLSDLNENDKIDYKFPLVICLCIIWIIVTFIVRQSTELVGRYLRYSFIVFLTLMGMCLLRFVPGSINMFNKIASPRVGILRTIRIIPLMAYSILGPGWGSVITMASFNHFKTNIFKFSWLISLMQFGIICGMTFLTMFLKTAADKPYFGDHPDWTNLLEYPSSIKSLGVSNIWSVFLFSMLTLGCLNLLVVQFLSFLTTIFDEFKTIRGIRTYVSLVTVALVVVLSTFLCSKDGIIVCENLSRAILLVQVVMDLLLLLVVFYVYGLDHFQRDLKFMTSQTISTGWVCLIVTLTPIILVTEFLLGIMWGSDDNQWGIFIVISLVIYLFFFLILFICTIPICCTISNYMFNIDIWEIYKNYIKPTNWYPAEPDDKESYEELLRQNLSQALSSNVEVNV